MYASMDIVCSPSVPAIQVQVNLTNSPLLVCMASDVNSSPFTLTPKLLARAAVFCPNGDATVMET